MSKKLNGNGLYESSRFIMPEHREALIAHEKESNKRSMPVLDWQEKELINLVLLYSLHAHERVRINVFDPYEDRELIGFVTTINNYLKEVKLCVGDDRYERIKFSEIVSAAYQ
ncbi:hypothetical protein M2277_004952 [Paenibacillus sp. LBL]|uniref:YolD-like family protein n=1 Tax=Paenibacillus sp. LBL TaxID=2940563 RepID=UPI002474399D|nr:YolD-like family protein [Paenibacillus sp. LBL]MDH6674260.1 hypothetical protein [Paenibacillus sp. LBL]